MNSFDDRTEWLEADGLGGFASGTATGLRTRRYHALLLVAMTPPTGRIVMVNGLDAWVTGPGGRTALSTQHYAPGVRHPDGTSHLRSFALDPWPSWTFETPDGLRIVHEVCVRRGGGTVLTWRLEHGAEEASLEVRPFFSGRDYHATHHENGAFRFDVEQSEGSLAWRPYAGLPAVWARTNGHYSHAPDWYRNFLYEAERERGLDDQEDLASPGALTFSLDARTPHAVIILGTDPPGSRFPDGDAVGLADRLRSAERSRREAFATTLDRAADAYIVRRGGGRSIVAGYPWFTDWGRDTFIALRGLCLATGRLEAARDVLVEWSAAVSEGMLPNRFADSGEVPEFNAVDASLWFVVAVHDLLEQVGEGRRLLSSDDRARLDAAVQQIIAGYASGTRYRIRAESDGLLAAGEPGVQLTWMDARVGDHVITPRVGKPVEVQALWLNALWIAARGDPRWQELFERGRRSFVDRFWHQERGCLFDVVDVDHTPGLMDGTVRPNQILAAGGLPLAPLEGGRARVVVDLVERELWTPFGLRSLARFEPGYAERYEGGPAARDAAYHQGTVWPWLLGPFVDAWIRVRGGGAGVRAEARERFVAPVMAHVAASGGHLCEITDAESPFTSRGCPFQAWSVGELIRADRLTAGPGRPAGS
ncbi:MAG: amylo-alpha-1,6-glucosidase [Acidobacteriota bacterium]